VTLGLLKKYATRVKVAGSNRNRVITSDCGKHGNSLCCNDLAFLKLLPRFSPCSDALGHKTLKRDLYSRRTVPDKPVFSKRFIQNRFVRGAVSALWLYCSGAAALVDAQAQTVGLIHKDARAYPSYTLFAPQFSTTTFLIDIDGRFINSWESEYSTALAVYLLENGHVLRCAHAGPGEHPASHGTGGATGQVQEFAWDGTLVWDFRYSDSHHLLHHDVEVMPNGNVLMIVWDRKTEAEAIAAGRNPSFLEQGELWPDSVIEVEPNGSTGGAIVWEWHIWDHLVQDYDPSKANYGVVGDHPELLDINYLDEGMGEIGRGRGADWNHVNAVEYNAQLDQIMITSRLMSEFYIIDHSTTTAEAAGHSGGRSGKGGDFLYRWGNAQVYRRGSEVDRQLYFPHDGRWIGPGLPGAGNILVFDNGEIRPGGEYSSVQEIVPPAVDSNGNYPLTAGAGYGPAEPSWIYTDEPPSQFYSQFNSNAQRLPNGNTFICSGTPGIFFEVTAEKETVWQYVNPVTATGPLTQGDIVPETGRPTRVFMCYRYAPDHPGLEGKDLTPKGPIELYPPAVPVIEGTPVAGVTGLSLVVMACACAGVLAIRRDTKRA